VTHSLNGGTYEEGCYSSSRDVATHLGELRRSQIKNLYWRDHGQPVRHEWLTRPHAEKGGHGRQRPERSHGQGDVHEELHQDGWQVRAVRFRGEEDFINWMIRPNLSSSRARA